MFQRYKVQRTEFFVSLDHFLPFDPPNNLESQNFDKVKKHLEILSLYTCLPPMTILQCMVSEILSATERTFCHFGLFFALLPPRNPKNQNFEKMKKAPGDIIILHMSTINKTWCIIPEIWSTTQNLFSFWTIFCPYAPPSPLFILLTAQKINSSQDSVRQMDGQTDRWTDRDGNSDI